MFERFKGNLLGDIYGGVTAAIVALPLALAFGIASGAGPVAGLYGAIVLGFFAAMFGGTPSQISGPTGPMTVVFAATFAHFTSQYPEQGAALAFTTVMLGGIIQFLMGVFRMGRFIIMVPYPVISGFMTGIGLIIILLQIGPWMGLPSSGSVVHAVAAIPDQIGHARWEAVSAGALTLALLFLWRGKFNRLLPAPLLSLLVGTAFIAFVAPGADIPRIGQIPSALPNLVLPAIRAELIPDMLSSAFMLAVLGSIDSLLTSLVADNITGEQHDSDKELRGQGLGNTLAGLVGGLPGAGATMRTVVNVRAGGKTPLSGVIHALILLVIALGLGFLFESIPQAVLAGILIKVGVDIIDWPFLKRLHRLPAFPVFLMLLVLGLTVFVDLITAVLVGVFIKNLVTLDKLSNLELGSVVMADGREPVDGLTPEEEAYLAQHPGETLLIKVTGPLSYAVGRRIVQRVKAFKDHSRLIIDLADASLVGISTAMVLEEIIDKALNAGMPVKLIGATGKAEAELRQLGIPEKLGDNNLSDNFQHAVGSN